jgi:DNA-binding response OmpR family regulator
MRLLVVEDSEKLRRTIRLALRKAGFVVDASGDGEEGLWLARENDYDAIVLDLMLPGVDGLGVLHRLRSSGGRAPVLILTVKSGVDDRVRGLRAGADDYLTKPFALDELLARVEALVRRKYEQRDPVLRLADLRVDTAARSVRRGSELVELTAREYRLLEFLARRAGEVVSRADIEQHLYGEETEVFSNTIESTISTLRRKLDRPGCVPLIQTRRGMGYVLQSGSA